MEKWLTCYLLGRVQCLDSHTAPTECCAAVVHHAPVIVGQAVVVYYSTAVLVKVVLLPRGNVSPDYPGVGVRAGE